LLTPREIREISERWNIVKLLDAGVSQREITEKLNCSITTVTRVARFLKDENNGGYRSVLSKISKHHHA
jgi:Trp operon repressor